MRVAIPELDPSALYDVTVEDGHFSSVRAVAERDENDADTPELWPGFVEAHAHLALPANFDDSLDDPRISALQYLYHGITHVTDLFGFPWSRTAGSRASGSWACPGPRWSTAVTPPPRPRTSTATTATASSSPRRSSC